MEDEPGGRMGRNVGLVIGAVVLVGALVIGISLIGVSAPQARKLDCSGLIPGGSFAFTIGGVPAELSIPEGEGATFGSFSVEVPSLGFHSGPLERDGSVEAVWTDDVNGDGREDGVLVIRSGGSGSYVELRVLESVPSGFTLRALPPLSAVASKGYMGHDVVSVRDGSITRSFPTYDDSGKVRIDRQWDLAEGAQGKSPVKTGSDSNADPSGRTRSWRFDYPSATWE